MPHYLFKWSCHHCTRSALWLTQGLPSWYRSVLPFPGPQTHSPGCITLENAFQIIFLWWVDLGTLLSTLKSLLCIEWKQINTAKKLRIWISWAPALLFQHSFYSTHDFVVSCDTNHQTVSVTCASVTWVKYAKAKPVTLNILFPIKSSWVQSLCWARVRRECLVLSASHTRWVTRVTSGQGQ